MLIIQDLNKKVDFQGVRLKQTNRCSRRKDWYKLNMDEDFHKLGLIKKQRKRFSATMIDTYD